MHNIGKFTLGLSVLKKGGKAIRRIGVAACVLTKERVLLPTFLPSRAKFFFRPFSILLSESYLIMRISSEERLNSIIKSCSRVSFALKK